MKKYSSKWLYQMVLLITSMIWTTTNAQSNKGLHTAYEQYWKEDISYLEKIRAEKDGLKAARILKTRKDEMLPKLENLVKETEENKKKSSAAEQKKEQEWVLNNPLQEKDADLQSEMMQSAGAKGDDFSKAVGEYMRASMAAIKRAKQ